MESRFDHFCGMTVTIQAGASNSLRRKGERINARALAWRESWPGWKHQLLGHIGRNEMREAANLVVCCTRHDSATTPWTAADDTGQREMFGHPTVLAHAPQLWKAMQRGIITRGCKPAVKDQLVAAGWKI
jgi:hypothetical protein